MAATTKASSVLVNSSNSSQPSASTPATAMGPRQKASASPRPKSQNETKLSASIQDTSVAGKHAADRLTFLMANFVGCVAYITVKNGDKFSGIFSAAVFDSGEQQYMLKMTKREHPSSTPEQANGETESTNDYVGYGEDHVMTFEVKDVISLNVPNVTTGGLGTKLTNGASFRTDADISGNLAVRERELQRWEPTEESNIDLSMNGSGRGWDQFETNERLYGVRTDYDENLYTTSIDRSHPTYKQRAAEAERLAKEIEGTATTNTHIAEERNLKSPEEDGMDEEESGVKRDVPTLPSSQPNKYTPPAMRPPTGQATVPGAPVDPAIISSQLLSADSSSSKAPTMPAAAPTTEATKETADPSESQAAEPPATTDEAGTEDRPASDRSAGEALKPLTTNTGTSPSRAQATSSQAAPNATANVEHQLADAFRTFAAGEKLRVQEKQREKQRQSARKEREVRLNDLKKFSANFKLNTAVPEDILGILARDKAKQVEIKDKAQQDMELRKAALAQSAAASSPEASEARAATTNQTEPPTGPAAQTGDRSASRAVRNSQTMQGFGRKGDRAAMLPNAPLSSARVPGHLGERLMAQQQLRGGRGFGNMPQQMPPQDPRMMLQQPMQAQPQPPPGPPAAINTDVAVARQSAAPTPNSAASRFNAQASEFKPNPTATTFLPGGEESSTSTSPTRSRTQARRNTVNRVGFFGDKKPGAEPKKSIADAFNPILRMKQEAIDSGKAKDFAGNGGIPQAYRTPPTWEAGKGNEEKTYVDMFESTANSTLSASPGSYPMAHQHQLPPHLQQGSQIPPHMNTPQQAYRVHPNGQPRDNYFEENHRMHPSSSQQSSVVPSPSFRQPMLAGYQHQMGAGPMQPQFMQNMGQFQIGPHGQPVTPMRNFPVQFMTPQGAPVAAPMMPSHSNNGQYLGFQMQGQMQGQMPMYSPGGHQVFPGQVSVPHTPGQGGYPSPRPGPQMMVPQGSQGHGSPHYMMAGPNPQGGPGSFGKQHPNQMPMRGGVPMMPQGSYGSSPHMQAHFPAQQQRGGGPNFGGGMNYGYQQMHPGQMMPYPQGQQHMPGGPIRRPSEQSDVK